MFALFDEVTEEELYGGAVELEVEEGEAVGFCKEVFEKVETDELVDGVGGNLALKLVFGKGEGFRPAGVWKGETCGGEAGVGPFQETAVGSKAGFIGATAAFGPFGILET